MPIHDWARVEAGIFHDFHHEWISTVKHALNAGLLPDGYYALAEQVAGGLEPDLLALDAGPEDKPPPRKNGAEKPTHQGPAGVAVAVAPPRVRFTESAELPPRRRKRTAVAIRHVSGDRVVALVEIVSPGNKSSKDALRAFVSKAVEFLEAGIHLLLLDLVPPGPRDPQGIHGALWAQFTKHRFELPAEKRLTLAAYTGGRGVTAYVEPVAVGDSLPEMPLFLDAEAYVPVSLEPTYLAAFDLVPKRWRDILASSSTT